MNGILGNFPPSDFSLLRRGEMTENATPASKSWLRHQTRVLRERSGIKNLNPQVWRHQLCTEMLEQGVPAENVIGVMGRVSENMIEAYRHTNLRAKQEALGMARANVIAFPDKNQHNS